MTTERVHWIAAAILVLITALTHGGIEMKRMLIIAVLLAGGCKLPDVAEPDPAPIPAPAPAPAPVPVKPPEPPAKRPSDAIAYTGGGVTIVTIGSTYEGLKARITGSITGEAIVRRSVAEFAGEARIGDIIDCEPLQLRIAVIRSNEP